MDNVNRFYTQKYTTIFQTVAKHCVVTDLGRSFEELITITGKIMKKIRAPLLPHPPPTHFMLTCIKQQSRPDYFHVAVNWMLSPRYPHVTYRKLSGNLTSQTNLQILFIHDYSGNFPFDSKKTIE